MPTSKSADPAPPPLADHDTGEAILRLAAIHAACVAMSDAAAHLRRTSITAEAANAAALTRSLQLGPDSPGWRETMEAAEQMVQAAAVHFAETCRTARDIAAAPAGTPSTAP